MTGDLRTQQLDPGVTIDPSSSVQGCTFGAFTKIGPHSRVSNAVYGDFSYSGEYCIIENTHIGKFSNIAAMVRIGPTDHPFDRPTLHHFTYRPYLYGFESDKEAAFFAWRESRLAFLGHDTWVGHGAIIMPEVTVGNGAIIASGAVVTKDIPPYAVAAGVPAKIMKYRFPRDVIHELEDIAWWDWPIETISERLADFRCSAEAFIKKYAGPAL